MRTRTLLTTLLALTAFTGLLFGKAAYIPLPQKCQKSDLIAVIEIMETKPGGAAKPYLQLATAKVTETLKGKVSGDTFQLDFDNGLVCPNVTYTKGQRCLVFLTKQRSGHYATYNTYFGSYGVTNGMVKHWKSEGDATLEAVRAELQEHITKKGR